MIISNKLSLLIDSFNSFFLIFKNSKLQICKYSLDLENN